MASKETDAFVSRPETFIEGAGTTWGDGGFGYASEAYINAGFFNESYGVTL